MKLTVSAILIDIFREKTLNKAFKGTRTKIPTVMARKTSCVCWSEVHDIPTRGRESVKTTDYNKNKHTSRRCQQEQSNEYFHC